MCCLLLNGKPTDIANSTIQTVLTKIKNYLEEHPAIVDDFGNTINFFKMFHQEQTQEVVSTSSSERNSEETTKQIVMATLNSTVDDNNTLTPYNNHPVLWVNYTMLSLFAQVFQVELFISREHRSVQIIQPYKIKDPAAPLRRFALYFEDSRRNFEHYRPLIITDLSQLLQEDEIRNKYSPYRHIVEDIYEKYCQKFLQHTMENQFSEEKVNSYILRNELAVMPDGLFKTALFHLFHADIIHNKKENYFGLMEFCLFKLLKKKDALSIPNIANRLRKILFTFKYKEQGISIEKCEEVNRTVLFKSSTLFGNEENLHYFLIEYNLHLRRTGIRVEETQFYQKMSQTQLNFKILTNIKTLCPKSSDLDEYRGNKWLAHSFIYPFVYEILKGEDNKIKRFIGCHNIRATQRLQANGLPYIYVVDINYVVAYLKKIYPDWIETLTSSNEYLVFVLNTGNHFVVAKFCFATKTIYHYDSLGKNLPLDESHTKRVKEFVAAYINAIVSFDFLSIQNITLRIVEVTQQTESIPVHCGIHAIKNALLALGVQPGKIPFQSFNENDPTLSKIMLLRNQVVESIKTKFFDDQIPEVIDKHEAYETKSLIVPQNISSPSQQMTPPAITIECTKSTVRDRKRKCTSKRKPTKKRKVEDKKKVGKKRKRRSEKEKKKKET